MGTEKRQLTRMSKKEYQLIKKRELIKDFLKKHPEELNNIIIELRNKKINNIKNNN